MLNCKKVSGKPYLVLTPSDPLVSLVVEYYANLKLRLLIDLVEYERLMDIAVKMRKWRRAQRKKKSIQRLVG